MLFEIASRYEQLVLTAFVMLALFIILYPIYFRFNKLSSYSRKIQSSMLLQRIDLNWIILAAIVCIYILVPMSYWYSARSHLYAISGLLPWNDANGYFSCARSLLDGGELSSFCQRRPIYSFFLSSLMWLGKSNLQFVLLIQSIIIGMVSFFVYRCAKNIIGILPAIFVVLVLFSFATKFHLVTTMSENAGFIFGSLGLVFLLVGANKKSVNKVLIGVMLLTIGLTARSGAYLILLFIVLWGVIEAKKLNTSRIRFLLLSSAVMAFVFTFNSFLVKHYGNGKNSFNSNFSYVLYGLSAGGEGWTFVYKDRPELFVSGGEGAVSNKIYMAAIENIKNNPIAFVKIYIGSISRKAFKYVDSDFVRLVFYSLWLLGVVQIILLRKQAIYSLVGATLLGIVLSSPLIWAAGPRVYAASIAVDAIIVSFGAALFLNTLTTLTGYSKINKDKTCDAYGEFSVNMFTTIMISLLLIPALFTKNGIHFQGKESLCKDGERPLLTQIGDISPFIQIVNEGETSLFPLRVTQDSFIKGLQEQTAHRSNLIRLPAGHALIWAYQFDEAEYARQYQLKWKGESFPEYGSKIQICLGEIDKKFFGGSFKVSSMHQLTK